MSLASLEAFWLEARKQHAGDVPMAGARVWSTVRRLGFRRPSSRRPWGCGGGLQRMKDSRRLGCGVAGEERSEGEAVARVIGAELAFDC